jgi:eukaryotic-like serine/threonine-protein kinase
MQPGNVLCFPDNVSKLGDLGRAVDPDSRAAHIEHDIAGDETYAPPELLYGYVDPNFATRRLGCDLYLLGSFVVSLLTGAAMTPLVQANLNPTHRVSNWRGASYDEVLPYIKHSFYDVLKEIEEILKLHQIEKTIISEILLIISELCDPDPRTRGDRIERVRGGNQHSLERSISRLDLIAHRLSSYNRLRKSA